MFADPLKRNFIAQEVSNKRMTVTELANYYKCHPRSIERVLEEMGLRAITKRRTTSDTLRIKKILKDAGIDTDTLGQLLITLLAAGATDPDRLRVMLGVRGGMPAALFRPSTFAQVVDNNMPAANDPTFNSPSPNAVAVPVAHHPV
jgi:hypothetical protein